MSQFVVIQTSKKSDFDNEAKIVLESCKFKEINPGTYIGTSSASTAVNNLKNTNKYKSRGSVIIKFYYGGLTQS